jgi:hypothetical protein
MAATYNNNNNCNKKSFLDTSLVDFIFNIVSLSIEDFNNNNKLVDGKNCMGIYIYGGKCLENLINKNITLALNNKEINLTYNKNEGMKDAYGEFMNEGDIKTDMAPLEKYNYTDDIDGVILMNPEVQYETFDYGAKQDSLMDEFTSIITSKINYYKNFNFTLIGLLNFYLHQHSLYADANNLSELTTKKQCNKCPIKFSMNSTIELQCKRRTSNVSGAIVYNISLSIKDGKKIIILPIFENGVLFNVKDENKYYKDTYQEDDIDKKKHALLQYIVPSCISLYNSIISDKNPYNNDKKHIYVPIEQIKKSIYADLNIIKEREIKREKSLKRNAILKYCDNNNGYFDNMEITDIKNIKYSLSNTNIKKIITSNPKSYYNIINLYLQNNRTREEIKNFESLFNNSNLNNIVNIDNINPDSHEIYLNYDCMKFLGPNIYYLKPGDVINFFTLTNFIIIQDGYNNDTNKYSDYCIIKLKISKDDYNKVTIIDFPNKREQILLIKPYFSLLINTIKFIKTKINSQDLTQKIFLECELKCGTSKNLNKMGTVFSFERNKYIGEESEESKTGGRTSIQNTIQIQQNYRDPSKLIEFNKIDDENNIMNNEYNIMNNNNNIMDNDLMYFPSVDDDDFKEEEIKTHIIENDSGEFNDDFNDNINMVLDILDQDINKDNEKTLGGNNNLIKFICQFFQNIILFIKNNSVLILIILILLLIIIYLRCENNIPSYDNYHEL